MPQPIKIELIADGAGNVLVFENGRPVNTVYCDDVLAAELQEYLEQKLMMHPPSLEKDVKSC
jgi:ABC-type glutathione transport system ATPase component